MKRGKGREREIYRDRQRRRDRERECILSKSRFQLIIQIGVGLINSPNQWKRRVNGKIQREGAALTQKSLSMRVMAGSERKRGDGVLTKAGLRSWSSPCPSSALFSFCLSHSISLSFSFILSLLRVSFAVSSLLTHWLSFFDFCNSKNLESGGGRVFVFKKYSFRQISKTQPF